MFTVVAADAKTNENYELTYTAAKMIGNGSFGVVFQARIVLTGEVVAIKKVLQDKRFKVRSAGPPGSRALTRPLLQNRELDIMRTVSHPNVVNLICYFYNKGEKVRCIEHDEAKTHSFVDFSLQRPADCVCLV